MQKISVYQILHLLKNPYNALGSAEIVDSETEAPCSLMMDGGCDILWSRRFFLGSVPKGCRASLSWCALLI